MSKQVGQRQAAINREIEDACGSFRKSQEMRVKQRLENVMEILVPIETASIRF